MGTDPASMPIEEFWALIDHARETSGSPGDVDSDHDGQARALRELLTGRPREELVAFEHHYRVQLARAAQEELWAAGYLIADGMSDDSFDYFCDFLIGCGREIFERVVADPDAIAETPEIHGSGSVDNELLRYAVYKAYRAAYGEELPISDVPGEEMTGEEWEEWDEDPEDFARILPRLWALVGWDD